jgi:hypothetical protein
MYTRIASAYDQNPARIVSIARKNRKRADQDRGLKFGLLVTLAAGIVFVARHIVVGA